MFRQFSSSLSSKQKRTAIVLNCGSSSVKYQLFENDRSILRGSVDNIGKTSCVHKRHSGADYSERTGKDSGVHDYPSAIKTAIDSALSLRNEFFCVGHRVVHGGTNLTHPSLVDESVLTAIRSCSMLAPLHNPSNVRGIELALEMLPSVPQIACFDTAFHAQIPRKSYLYAIPLRYSDAQSIRRYGFHGLSYSYITSIVKESRIIVAHLGSGSSAAAIVDGVSIDTTMGFTPMEGIVMSSRSGSIDPGIVLHLARSFSGDVEKVSSLLNKESGLMGLSGFSGDMKELLSVEKDSLDPRSTVAHDAVEVFVHSVQKNIAQLLASLEFRVDAIVFTGGIGENSPEIRERVIRAFQNLGTKIDEPLNEKVPPNGIISSPASRIKIMAIPTNEEMQIARQAIEVASKS